MKARGKSGQAQASRAQTPRTSTTTPSTAAPLIRFQKILATQYQRQATLPRLLLEDQAVNLLTDEVFINLSLLSKRDSRMQETKSLQRQEATASDKRGAAHPSRLKTYEELYEPKEPIELNDLFKAQEHEAFPKRLLILGRAGIGKSTLCRYMAVRWSAMQQTQVVAQDALATSAHQPTASTSTTTKPSTTVLPWLSNITLLLWLPLRELRALCCSGKPLLSAAEAIHRVCLSSRQRRQITPSEIDRVLNQHESTCLLVLDGYDEIAQADIQGEFLSELMDELLDFSQVIVTSRPYQTQGLTQGHQRQRFNRTLEIMGFTQENIRAYIKRFHATLAPPQEQLGKSLYRFLAQNPSIFGVAHIPILLEILCSVQWLEASKQAKPTLTLKSPMTMTALFERMVNEMAIYYLHRQSNDSNSLEDIDAQAIEQRCIYELQAMEAIAYQGMIKNTLYFEQGMIRQALKQLRCDEGKGKGKAPYHDLGMLLARLKRFGLLKPISRTKTAAGYYFVHLTVQEFFAARYIARHFGVFANSTRDTATARGYKNIVPSIQAYKYHPHFEIVWWFVAGLCRYHEKALQTFFDTLLSPPRDRIGVYAFHQLMRCWDETGPLDKTRRGFRSRRNLRADWCSG